MIKTIVTLDKNNSLQADVAPERDAASAAVAEGPPAEQEARATSISAVGLAMANLRSMSRACGRGAVDYRYDPSSLIQCLLLKSKLKPSVTLQDCLSSVAPLLFGKIAGGVLANALREGSMRLPQDSVLRDAQIRPDLLNIAYER